MARRSREAIQKRLREQRRAEKAALKRQKRLERKQGVSAEPEEEPAGADLASVAEEAPAAQSDEELVAPLDVPESK